MSDIFLSYASEDLPRVGLLIRALERHGWSVWWDQTIPLGRTFDQVIEEALDAARCVQVYLWSVAITTETSAANVHTVAASDSLHRMGPKAPSPPALWRDCVGAGRSPSRWERALEAPPGLCPGAWIVGTLLLGSVALFVYPQRYQKIQLQQEGEANDTG